MNIISGHMDLGIRMDRAYYEEQFNKTAPSNKTILAIIKKFHCTGSVLCNGREQHFGDRLISHRKEFPFPLHSLDLMTPDAYIWGMLKESVFRSDDPPRNVPELWEKIKSFFRVLATTCVYQHVQQSK